MTEEEYQEALYKVRAAIVGYAGQLDSATRNLPVEKGGVFISKRYMEELQKIIQKLNLLGLNPDDPVPEAKEE